MNEQMSIRLNQKLLADLGPVICEALEDKQVIEIIKNSDGSVWLEKVGQPMERIATMRASEAEAIINTVASALSTSVTEEKPLIECELPISGSRFTGVIRPLARNPLFSIRKKALKIFTLEEYVAAGSLNDNQKQHLNDAIVQRQNILIVGGTGTGKTTFANAILREISEVSPDDRLLILEDTPELQSAAANTEFLKRTDYVDLDGCVRLTLRLRPDRVVVGEVRGGEALSLLKVWNTGHPGGLATIHADDAKNGLIRLEQLIGEVSQTPMQKLIAAAVGVIVVIVRAPEGRKIRQICTVDSWDGSDYQLREII